MEGTVQLPTVLENDRGFGGMGLGAGFIGGLVLGSIWNGNGFGGWGNRGAGQVGADVAIANQLEHVSDQVQQATISNLQSANGTQMQVANSAAGVTAGITQNTIAGLQSQSALQQQMCCCCNNLSKEIDSTGDGITAAITNGRIQDMQNTQSILGGMANLGQAITAQGYQAQLMAKDQTILLGGQHSQIMAAIADSNARNEQQHCQDRELMRQIATEALQAKLTEAQAKIVQLETQNYVNQSNSQQTLYLINQLKPTTTTTAAA